MKREAAARPTPLGATGAAALASTVLTTLQRASVVSRHRISYPARSGSLLPSKRISAFGVTAPPSVTSTRGRGRIRHLLQRLLDDVRRLGDEVEVHELHEVAVLDAVLDARSLVLVVVILERLRETHGGKTRLDERPMVPASPEAVEPKDQAHLVLPVDLLHQARHLAARRVDSVRAALGEHAHAPVGTPIRGAHDVAGDHAAHCVALLREPLEETLAAEEALLLARDRSENERRARPRRRERPRREDRHGRAGGVVVGAGCVRRGVHDVRRHRVVVAGDDEGRALERRVRAREDRVDVFHRDGRVLRARRARLEFVDDDPHPLSRLVFDRFEVADDHVAPAADSALRVRPGGQGVASAARDERFDDGSRILGR